MTPEQIKQWLSQNLWRLDQPNQWLGTEPNSRRKPWDSAQVRWLLAASWPYFHSAGNQSIPAVYQAINDHDFALADLSYLHETPRDMAIFERDRVPIFGIESQHQMLDFDVAATSISYSVLFMNFCNTGEAPIWMGDLSFKPLSKVQAGDEVLGWEWADSNVPGRRPGRKLVRSRVKAIVARQAPVVRVTMESGKVIRCTPDHKWLSHQRTAPGAAGKKQDCWTTVGGVSPAYSFRERRHGRTVHLGSLTSVVDLPPELTAEQQREADWLAGVYDGEGNANHIAQSRSHNPEMCARIERAFTVLGIPLKTYDQANGCRKFMLAGGRQTYVNWLNWTQGTKRQWFEQQATGRMMSHRDRVMKIEPDGVDTVYSMETETGNYVAWGLASKNCKLLSMSNIPLRWRDRESNGLQNYPMIMVGGQAFCAPEFMAPVVDCVWLGEVEDEPNNGGIGTVSSRIAMFKEEGRWQSDRLECYRQLALEFNHLYFPRFVKVRYSYVERPVFCDAETSKPTTARALSKQVSGYENLLPGMRVPFTSRIVHDLDAVAPLRSAPLLFSDPGMGLGDLEVGRGCTCWCSFCRLSWVTKPYRQRSVGESVKHAKTWTLNMGSAELSPFAPDFPVHTRKKELLAALLEQVSDEIDTTALRVDDFIADEQYVLMQAAGGADAITIGVEGASQRMRDLVGKGASDQDVEDAVVQGIRAGFRKFKLFMINNLPGEDRGDVLKAIALARRLADVREQMGAKGVIIQLSLTPLLIEAQTPFQWFAPTPPNHDWIEVADALRDLGVQFKLGTKANPAKVALFQACQRASRDVGEAIVDVLEAHAIASWGGVPKSLVSDLESALIVHGFRNGYGDIFDERFQHDLFGWEFISTGVSQHLMWQVYQQMLEFVQGTDSETYDQQFSDAYHGQEFIGRCDTNCLGSECGACNPLQGDYTKRAEYVRAADDDRDIDLHPVQVLDQTTAAVWVRARIERPVQYRTVGNQHWRAAVRRAAYRAIHECSPGFAISKRSILFASDAVKAKDWTAGTDYVQFALTEGGTSAAELVDFLAAMHNELEPWLQLGRVRDDGSWAGEWNLLAHNDPMTAQAFYELEADVSPEELRRRLKEWDAAEHVLLKLMGDAAYFGLASQEVNAKELVKDIWAVRDGHRLALRFITDGKAGSYLVAAALLGKPSWLPLARYPVIRLDWLVPGTEQDATCSGCGQPLPGLLLLGPRLQYELCPRCQDDRQGRVIAGIREAARV